jgi:hypothetical protein
MASRRRPPPFVIGSTESPHELLIPEKWSCRLLSGRRNMSQPDSRKDMHVRVATGVILVGILLSKAGRFIAH